MNFTEKLNFSDKQRSSSAVKLHNRNRDLGYYYDNLCLYCANNDIDINSIDDIDFMSAAQVMADYGKNDISTDHYWFWIDDIEAEEEK